MGRDNGVDGWCILRCSAARTLLVATSLANAGVEVWTPSEIQQRRRGRNRDRVDCEIAIMPTFVFARAAELGGLFAILASPLNPHPAFSIFRFHGRIPIVSEGDVSALRRAEEKARTRRLRTERKVIPVGTSVLMNEGGFAGMSGVVEESDGKFALVAFGGSFRVKIATFLFGTDAVHQPQAREGVAA